MSENTCQFVILEHTIGKKVHWDLMLEDEGVLLTWRLEVPPEQVSDKPVHAEKINDHPLRFLDYEGPVQKNTGQIKRADRGSCKWVTKEANQMTAELNGKKLSGLFKLQQFDNTWVMTRIDPRS